MNNTKLANKSCIPCKGDTPHLEEDKIKKLLSEIGSGWALNETGHLYKIYKFNDFMKPMDFANKIAKIAEQEGHHPNLAITWGQCGVEIWTHKINGLTESDFILAAKIETGIFM